MNHQMNARPDILCIGAMLWDVIGRAPQRMAQGADVPGRIRHLPGGVALNVAIAIARWGLAPAILSAVGRDPEGDALIAEAERSGILTGWLTRDTGIPTDCYMGIEDSHGLIAAIADVHGLERAGDTILAPLAADLAGWNGPVVLDGNLTETLLVNIIRGPALANADLRIVPASPGKADRLRPLVATGCGCLYLNRIEAEIIAGFPCHNAKSAAEAVIALGAARVVVTDGAFPAADATAGQETLTEAPPAVTIARVTGAGDCFLAAHLAAELRELPRKAALRQAVQAAAAHVSGKDPS